MAATMMQNRFCVLFDAADTGTEVLKVKGCSMEARFHSDGSGNDWGYKFTVSFFAKAPVGMTPFFKVISPTLSVLPLSHFIMHGLHHEPSLPDTDVKPFALYVRPHHSLALAAAARASATTRRPCEITLMLPLQVFERASCPGGGG